MVTKKEGRKKASRKAFSRAPMELLELAVAIKCFSTLDLAITRREVHIEKSSPLSLSLESQMQNMKTNWEAASNRGRAEKEPRILIPVLAVPVSELLAGKNWKICKSLN